MEQFPIEPRKKSVLFLLLVLRPFLPPLPRFFGPGRVFRSRTEPEREEKNEKRLVNTTTNSGDQKKKKKILSLVRGGGKPTIGCVSV